MTTLTLSTPQGNAFQPFPSESDVFRLLPEKARLLILTADEPFWQRLLRAASAAARNLVRKRDIHNTDRTLYLLKPGAVLLDLDLDPPSAWNAADALLCDTKAPPLLLLTSRRDQIEFRTAIEAGSLVDKHADPGKTLALAELALDLSNQILRERNAMQQLVIRWLKPFAWSAQGIRLRRFWGINE